MFLDLLLPHRRQPRAPTPTVKRHAAQQDDFRDTVPSMFWLDSEPLPVEACEATRPLVRRPATMVRC